MSLGGNNFDLWRGVYDLAKGDKKSEGSGGSNRTYGNLKDDWDGNYSYNGQQAFVDPEGDTFIKNDSGKYYFVGRNVADSESMAMPEEGGLEWAMGIAQQQIDLSKEALAFQKGIATEQLELAKRAQAIAEERYNYWKTYFQPIEKKVAASANVGLFGDYYADRAGADVTQSFDKAMESQGRQMASLGIDAASPKYVALQQNLQLARAAAEAGAKTNARNAVRDLNYSRRINAVQIGQGLPAQALAGIGQTAQITGMAGSAAGTGFQQGLGALSSAGQLGANAYNALASQQLAAAQLAQNQSQFNANMAFQQRQIDAQKKAALFGSIGSLGGMAIGAGLGSFAGPMGALVGAQIGAGVGGGAGGMYAAGS